MPKLRILLWLILILHGEPDMVGLLAILVLDGDGVVASILLTEVSDRQSTVSPVPASLKEGLLQKRDCYSFMTLKTIHSLLEKLYLISFVIIEAAQKRLSFFEPRCLMF